MTPFAKRPDGIFQGWAWGAIRCRRLSTSISATAAFRASVAAGQSGWNAWGSPRLAGAFRLRTAGGQAEKECRAGNAGSLQRGEETTGSAIGRFGGHRQRAAEFGRAPRNG